MKTYARTDEVFVDGRGAVLIDNLGREHSTSSPASQSAHSGTGTQNLLPTCAIKLAKSCT